MAKMRFMMVDVEGDEQTILAAIRAAASTIAGHAVAETRGNGDAAIEPAGRLETENEIAVAAPAAEPRPAETPGSLPASPRPRVPASPRLPSPRKHGRRVIIEGVDGTHTTAEAAAILGCSAGRINGACAPSGDGKARGRKVRWADDPSPQSSALGTERYESRPRGNGDSLPINPARVGAGPDPEPDTGVRNWKSRSG